MDTIPTHKPILESITSTETFIFVTLQKEGIHQYPAAKDLPGVEFLAFLHRHIFHIKAQIQVYHHDRELEFVLVKRWIESLYGENVLELNHKSCEMIANDLISHISAKYGYNRIVVVEVSEDGENGAIVKRSPVRNI